MQKSPIFIAAIDILNNSSIAKHLLGSPIKSYGLARGTLRNGFATITFVVSGSNGDYLVMLSGKCSQDGKYQIENLSMHKRSSSPIEEFYIIMNGKLLDSDGNEEDAAELIEQ